MPGKRSKNIGNPTGVASSRSAHQNGRIMSQSLSVVYLHAVFATKERRPFLADPNLRREFHAYLGGVSARLDCPPVIVGGVEDHIHILVRMGRETTQSGWLKELKRVSSVWIKSRDASSAGASDFAWQAGYGVFSVSASNMSAVREYIANQEEHHRKVSFREEYEALLRKHGAEYDADHLWDE
jgi:putative transposase